MQQLQLDQRAHSYLREYGQHIENRQYRYFCDDCCRNFESNEKAEKCMRCGSVSLRILYPWKAQPKSIRAIMLKDFDRPLAKGAELLKRLKISFNTEKNSEEMPSR